MTTFSILTVCTGNICRSPMAQQLIEKGVQAIESVMVSSAGTGALVGQPMTNQAQAIARELGATDPSAHVARSLTLDHLREVDLVLALSREHRRAVVEMLPRAARHTFTLREFARLLVDVDNDDFESIGALAADDVAGRLGELVEIAASRRGAVLPPSSPDDDDVIDPYRRDDATYWASADQIVPAVGVLLAEFERALGARV